MVGFLSDWRGRSGMVAVAAAVVALLGVQVGATAQQDDAPAGGNAAALVDRLVELERQLPALPPDDVLLDEEDVAVEFTGDFTGADVLLDTIVEDARALFVEAHEAGTDPLSTAVSDAARSIVELSEGYGLLAEYEAYDLAFPVEEEDDEGVATGADEPYGLAAAGLRLVLDAHARRLPAFLVLRDAEVVDGTERELFEVLHDAEVAFDTEQRPLLHRALGLDTTQVLRVVERFETGAPGTEARARSLTVVCIARDAYAAAEEDVLATPESLVVAGQAPAADCPDVTNGGEARLVAP